MNANKILCKSRLFIFDANASYKDADAKYPCDAHVSFQRCDFRDADVPCRGANAKFIHDGANAHIYTMMQMSPCRDGDAKILWCECPLMGMS